MPLGASGRPKVWAEKGERKKGEQVGKFKKKEDDKEKRKREIYEEGVANSNSSDIIL